MPEDGRAGQAPQPLGERDAEQHLRDVARLARVGVRGRGRVRVRVRVRVATH